MFDNYFKNKKVVIIGASGSLGRVYTRAFHQAGARLYLLGRDIEKLKMFVQEFSSFIPISSVDITSEESLKNVVSEIQEWSECIDIVINATGFDVRKSLSAHSLEDIEQTLLINLSGAILISKIFLPLLANEKCATIVHSGGFADGRIAFPYYSVDVASRAGIFSFIESMNRELRQEQKKMYLTYFCPNAADTPSEKPYHPVWEEMGIKISTTDEVCLTLLKGIKSHQRVILMGRGASLFAKLNLLSSRLADFLLLDKYSRILKKHFS